MEFDYLSDVPVLTIDVNEEFKGNNTKSADMIEKVSDGEAFLKVYCFRICVQSHHKYFNSMMLHTSTW